MKNCYTFPAWSSQKIPELTPESKCCGNCCTIPVQNKWSVLLLSRLQHWWRRRPEDIDPQRTTWATCPLLTSQLLRWQTSQTSSDTFLYGFSQCKRNDNVFLFVCLFVLYHPLDRNYEEWIWAAGSPAANGAPEHEEVNTAHRWSLRWCNAKAWLYLTSWS